MTQYPTKLFFTQSVARTRWYLHARVVQERQIEDEPEGHLECLWQYEISKEGDVEIASGSFWEDQLATPDAKDFMHDWLTQVNYVALTFAQYGENLATD